MFCALLRVKGLAPDDETVDKYFNKLDGLLAKIDALSPKKSKNNDNSITNPMSGHIDLLLESHTLEQIQKEDLQMEVDTWRNKCEELMVQHFAERQNYVTEINKLSLDRRNLQKENRKLRKDAAKFSTRKHNIFCFWNCRIY